MASASPSYIPLAEYKAHSPGPPGTSPSLQELPIYDDQENPADLEADLKPNRFSRPLSYRQDPDHPDTLIMLGGVWQVIKTLVLPLVAIGYLSFCYTVHQRVVPLKSYGLFNVTQEHLGD
ncbi:hypothetical protein BJ138DRAFT_1121112 [Hygrophoropsis aurantiaca]|uniref:Uncharacterized protein n=1 Tax=Hygrophoropsis aurantiaca TaxID=72124 RepID=A0ACB7ZPF1_9AGAM|nr:hypothetical protein BJ138DRAFT_1121112 [Hygrophoropsis aurantiaca]